MSALLLKSANHLSRIFKVYLAMAIFGALAVIVVELFLAKPIVLLGMFLVLTTLCTVSVLWAQAQRVQKRKRATRMLLTGYLLPPQLPESLLLMLLPRDIAESVIGDLSKEYFLLSRGYGRQSANSWYVTQCIHLILYSVKLHLRLTTSEELARFLKKEIS